MSQCSHQICIQLRAIFAIGTMGYINHTVTQLIGNNFHEQPEDIAHISVRI